MNRKLLFSIFDLTGNASFPYLHGEWDVVQIDIQLGIDFLKFDYKNEDYHKYDTIGIICMMPCTDYAVSGAKHFKRKDADGTTEQSQKLVRRFKQMLTYWKRTGKLQFWQLENPRTRIHTLNKWLGKPLQKSNPTDYAGYDPVPDNSRYNKETWFFGEFELMIPKYMTPLQTENPGWKKFGGKSLKTKNARSVTPMGLAYAFYETNH